MCNQVWVLQLSHHILSSKVSIVLMHTHFPPRAHTEGQRSQPSCRDWVPRNHWSCWCLPLEVHVVCFLCHSKTELLVSKREPNGWFIYREWNGTWVPRISLRFWGRERTGPNYAASETSSPKRHEVQRWLLEEICKEEAVESKGAVPENR